MRHRATAGTARMRKYVNMLGRPAAMTFSGVAAAVFIGGTSALGARRRQCSLARSRIHELGIYTGRRPPISVAEFATGDDQSEPGQPKALAQGLCRATPDRAARAGRRHDH